MWSLLQPSSTPPLEKSLASSMNMPILGRDHPIHSSGQLEWFKTHVDEKSIKVVWYPTYHYSGRIFLSLSSSRMVWPMPPLLEDPQIRIWTHTHMSSLHLLMNGILQSLTMILHPLMDWTPVKCLTQPFGDPHV